MKTVLEVLQDQLKEAEDVRKEEVLRGMFKTYDEYRYACGILRGLALALDAVKAIAKNQEESDNE
jgi:hypothetical protein